MRTAALVVPVLEEWCVLVFCAIEDVLGCYWCFFRVLWWVVVLLGAVVPHTCTVLAKTVQV
jgi:hypothetical protein